MPAEIREELANLIRRGQTVIHNGRAIRSIGELPSEVELAGTDIVRKQHYLGGLDAEINRLLAEKALATGGGESAPTIVVPGAPESTPPEAPAASPKKATT